MNCAYHHQNAAVVGCNGCGRPLCPACDHRIKGFPYCQDCIVTGIDLLREQSRVNYVNFIDRRTSPLIATVLSMVCPGLGAAYNGQTVKALVYFGVFAGLFQMAILTRMPLFVFGLIAMWFFAALDACRTAQTIRSGLTPETANDILAERFSGNPKLWGIALILLGLAFVFQKVLSTGFLFRALLPFLLIGLGIYVLRSYIFNNKGVLSRSLSPASTNLMHKRTSYTPTDYNIGDSSSRWRSGSWKES